MTKEAVRQLLMSVRTWYIQVHDTRPRAWAELSVTRALLLLCKQYLIPMAALFHVSACWVTTVPSLYKVRPYISPAPALVLPTSGLWLPLDFVVPLPTWCCSLCTDSAGLAVYSLHFVCLFVIFMVCFSRPPSMVPLLCTVPWGLQRLPIGVWKVGDCWCRVSTFMETCHDLGTF